MGWNKGDSRVTFFFCLFLSPLCQGVSLSMHSRSSRHQLCSDCKFGEAFSKFLSERYASGWGRQPGLICALYPCAEFMCTWDCAMCFQSILRHGILHGQVSAAKGAAADPPGFTADIPGFLLCWEKEESCPGRTRWKILWFDALDTNVRVNQWAEHWAMTCLMLFQFLVGIF